MGTRDLTREAFDIAPDENDSMVKMNAQKKWDAKRRKYVMVRPGEEKAKRRNEAGAIINPKDVKKSGLYEQWKQKKRKSIGGAEASGGDDLWGDDSSSGKKGGKARFAYEDDGGAGGDEESGGQHGKKRKRGGFAGAGAGAGAGGRPSKKGKGGGDSELKAPEQIRKERMKKKRQSDYVKFRHKQKGKK